MSTPHPMASVALEICTAKGLTLIGHAGDGAFKSVFHVQSGKKESYALKIIKDTSGHSLVRTSREIDALNKCNHPNIAQLYASETFTVGSDAYTFTVEEYLDGGTLGARIAAANGLPALDVIHVGERLIDALGHLEPLKLVHRDIKPENIMFRSGSNEPVLVDFGIVRDLSASSLTQTFVCVGPGTPYFAAPEQLNNKKRLINWRTDQFGLGVTLSFAHLQRHPFQYPGEPFNSPDTIARVQGLGAHNHEVMKELKAANLHCIEKMTCCWPVERYQSPAELLSAWTG